MAAERDVDELAALMPRTKAANDRAQVDVRSLKQYMEASKQNALNATRRSSVMVRSDVRKDNQGFEDIDEFWADDDDDFDDDDDEASVSERDISTNVSMGSMTSERQVRLSGMSAASHEYEFGGGDGDDGNLSTDTMDLDEELDIRRPSASAASTKSKTAAASSSKDPSARGSVPPPSMATPLRAAPRGSNPRFSKFSTASSPAPSHDFNMSTSFDTGSAMKPIPIPSKREKSDLASVKRLIARKSLQAMSPIRVPASTKASSNDAAASSAGKASSSSARKRDSFGDDAPGFDNVSSPFSLGDDPVSPLSNASERDLDAVKFSAKEATGTSPTIRKKLFKGDKAGDRAGDAKGKRAKGKAAESSSSTVSMSAPASGVTKNSSKAAKAVKKPTKRSRAGKPVTAADDPQDQQTDNDSTLNARTSDEDNDNDGDSDFDGNGDGAKRSKASRAYARDLFDNASSDDDGNDHASGTRRSKRRRFKPLAWYKGEHYIYERRSSGVGLVIPTVAGIERVGTSTPTKTARKYTKRAGAQRKSVKALPKTQLPKGLTFEEGEWADLYDTSAGCVNKMNVICRASEIEHRELPSVDGERAGFAGQSFNLRSSHPFSRWICGRLGLPAGAAKEAESVGDAVQVFYVTNCQPQSVEVAFGPVTDEYFDTAKATRFLLNPGDEFYVPSRNAYYLKNYSDKTACDLHFTIMKPDLPATIISSATAAATASGSPDAPTTAANVSDRRAKKKRLKP